LLHENNFCCSLFISLPLTARNLNMLNDNVNRIMINNHKTDDNFWKYVWKCCEVSISSTRFLPGSAELLFPWSNISLGMALVLTRS
jgi:hypothetical protein